MRQGTCPVGSLPKWQWPIYAFWLNNFRVERRTLGVTYMNEDRRLGSLQHSWCIFPRNCTGLQCHCQQFWPCHIFSFDSCSSHLFETSLWAFLKPWSRNNFKKSYFRYSVWAEKHYQKTYMWYEIMTFQSNQALESNKHPYSSLALFSPSMNLMVRMA